MKDRISALMDGELEDRDAGETISLLATDAEARSAWRTYHLIGDALREGHTQVHAAARPLVRPAGRWRFIKPSLSWASAAAAVALVAWVAFAPVQTNAPPAPAVAQARPPVIVPPPGGTNDYLLAHQGFSPRVALQGMAPYVLTVSDPAPQDPRK